MTKTTAAGFVAALIEAGVLTKEQANNTERLVIDVQGGSLTIYRKEFGDGEALAKLAPMLKGLLDGED